jgi:ubiquinone/menaquinone biosynthesis C-methylase UbiE
LPIAGNSVDLIVCEMVFEHVAEPEKMIREFHRCLKPDGRIIFITPNFMCYPYLVSRLMPYWFHKFYGVAVGRQAADIFPTHYRLNTIPAIQRYFAQAGFKRVFLKQLDASSDYMALFPIIYLLAVFYSRLISKIEALSFLRQFHVGCFCKP